MFSFKKIASVLTSAVMLSSTMGFAMAASYPVPFVESGLADAAVVYGANAAISDVTAAIDVQQKLGALATSGTATTSASVTGEAAQLFSGGTKLYVNDSLNTVKTVLTKSDLPTVLADGSFSGNVDATITQTIDIGSNPSITFKKQPTSSDDPLYALTTSTTQKNYIFNLTATFNKAVNLSHADSEGESINLFGQTFTIAAATDVDTLVLLKSAEKVSLTSDNPTADVTIDGEVFTIELISASDTSATIGVTDSAGNTESKEVDEAASKKINDVEIAVTTADETNIKLSATVVAGSDKFTLEDGSSVTQGSDNTVVDGTLVDIPGNPTASTEITISYYATESDEDAVKPGETYIDSVFGTVKLDFSGFNIPSALGDETSSRETISVTPNGDAKMDVTFTDHRGYEKTITWAKNDSLDKLQLMRNDDFNNISVFEMENLSRNDYVVVGNEDEGYLLRLSSVKNQSSGYSSDQAKFTDVFSGDVYETTWTKDGSGTLTVGGKSYTVTMKGIHTAASEDYRVTIDQPDSTANTQAVIYPTIQTSKGAKVAFYEPITVNITKWNTNLDEFANNLTDLRFPDGDGYTNVNFEPLRPQALSIDDGVTNLTVGNRGDTISVGQLTYNFTYAGNFSTTVYLLEVDGAGNIIEPALIIFEEQDDNNQYQALIVELEEGSTGDDGIGVESIEDTWSNADSAWKATRASDSKIEDRGDLFGTLITKDSSDSDQPSATISYPDEQIYAQIYMAEEGASITPGQTGGTGGGQVLIVKDSEVSSVASKNLFVVGGSCINTVAAKILDSDVPLCEADFTDATGAGAGQYIIKSVTSPYSDDKIAMLVAGYEAAETLLAVDKALEGVSTDVDTSQVYPITATTTETGETE